jgi:hypothetical protein
LQLLTNGIMRSPSISIIQLIPFLNQTR